MQFSEIYGTRADDLLGSADRTQRFTTAKRKQYANDGQKKFNEQTGCYTKRLSLAIVDGTQEYDIETAATDFLLAVMLLAGLPVALIVAGLFGPTSEIVDTFSWILAASFVATGAFLIAAAPYESCEREDSAPA